MAGQKRRDRHEIGPQNGLRFLSGRQSNVSVGVLAGTLGPMKIAKPNNGEGVFKMVYYDASFLAARGTKAPLVTEEVVLRRIASRHVRTLGTEEL